MSLPSINFLHLTVSEIQPGQDFQTQGHYSKVKSRSDHDVAHLHPLTNVPAKYQLPTPHGCRDIARTRLSNSRSLQQGQRSNQGQTMTLHTYTPQPISLLSMNFLHLTVSEIQPGQTVSRSPPAHPDTTGENNTPTALKRCGVIRTSFNVTQYYNSLKSHTV